MLTVGCLTAAIVLAAIIPEKGEVVQLMTRDPEGQQRETDLWITEVEEQTFIRAGSSRVAWLSRLASSEPAYLRREGQVIEIESQMVNDPELRARVDRAMAEKYGLADDIWSVVRSSSPVAIRVHPVLSNETLASKDELDKSRTRLDLQ